MLLNLVLSLVVSIKSLWTRRRPAAAPKPRRVGGERRSPDRHVYPTLEILEARVALNGTFTWKGGDTGNVNTWADKNNWNASPGANVTYPGQNGSINDNVVFDNTATADAYLTSSITIASLTLKANFAKTFEVQNGKGLTITTTQTGGLAPNYFDMEGGTLNLRGGSWIALNGTDPTTTTPALWNGGDLNSAGDQGGKIYVYNGTNWTIVADATKLGATLVIGQSQTGADSVGIVNLGERDGSAGLSGNLTLYQNVGIQVKPKGRLLLNQPVNSNTKGGIVNNTGSTGAIDNQGLIERTQVDGTNYLTLGPQITNSADTSKFMLDKNTKVNFQQPFQLNAGEFNKQPGSDNKGKIDRNGGKITLADPGTPGQYVVYFSGDVTLQGPGVALEFDDTTPGAFGTMIVTGNFDVESGATISINVDGTTPETTDQIQVTGLTTINGALLNVTTLNASPQSGYTYTFLSPQGGFSGTGWGGSPTDFGYPANYIFLEPWQIQEL